MKRWFWRLFLLAVLVAAGIWVWRTFFPGQEQLILRQLTKLAQTACISPGESNFARIANAQKLTTFFTTNAEVIVNIPGRLDRTFTGQEELLEAAGGARAYLHSLKVEFIDPTITLDPDKTTAEVTATVRITMSGEGGPEVQEVKAELVRNSREWLIRRAETVKVLK